MKTLVRREATDWNQRSIRSGVTLVELTASMTIMVILMGAMTSTILIAGFAIPDGDDPALKKLAAMDVVDQIAGELFYATSITEETDTAVTFTVADRGHGAAGPETIRYAWSGTPGDPLTRQYNGGTVFKVCDATQLLTFTFERRAGELRGYPRVLLVVPNEASLGAGETARKTALETWGFTVQLISGSRPAAEFAAPLANNDVVYIVKGADAISLGNQLPSLPIGIVNEVTNHFSAIGVAESGTFSYGIDFIILNNTHEITSVFSAGSLPIVQIKEDFAVTKAAISAGTQALGMGPGGFDSLLVMDAGGVSFGGGAANSRRVCLPWAGWKTFNFNNVNSDGLRLLRRSIVWAAAPTVYVGVRIALLPSGAQESLRSEAQVFNRPKVTLP